MTEKCCIDPAKSQARLRPNRPKSLKLNCAPFGIHEARAMGSLSVAYLCGQVPATNPRPEIIGCAGGPFLRPVALWSPEYMSVLRHCHLRVPEVLRVQDLMLRVARPCHYRSPPVPLRSHQHHRQAQKTRASPKEPLGRRVLPLRFHQ